MDRRVTPPKQVTSPTCGPPPPCKQAVKLGSHGTGRIFDRQKNLTGHFVHTAPFNIFTLFTGNFERLGI